MAFNPLNNYLQGQKAGQAQQSNRLAGALAGQMGGGQDPSKLMDFQQLMAIDPDRANKIVGSFNALSKNRKKAWYDDMVTGQAILGSGDVEGTIQFLEGRGETINELGGDSFSNDYMLNNLRAGNIDVVMNSLNQAIEAGGKLKILSEAKSKKPKEFANVVSPIQTDEETGQQYVAITNPQTQETKRVDIAGGKALTRDEKDQKLARKALIDDARKVSSESFESLRTVRSGLGAYNDAIDAIDAGANSGKMQSFLPSFTEATINLENAAARLGLNIIQATTFGALSEGELKLAMDTGKPPLEPVALRKWLVEKRDSQKKLGQELRKMSIALGKGKMTVAEYMERTGYAESEMSLDKMSDEDLFN